MKISNQTGINFIVEHINKTKNVLRGTETPEKLIQVWEKLTEIGREAVYSISYLQKFKSGDCDDYTAYFLATIEEKKGFFFCIRGGGAYHIAPFIYKNGNKIIFDPWVNNRNPIKWGDRKKFYKADSFLVFEEVEKMRDIEMEFIEGVEDSIQWGFSVKKLKGALKKGVNFVKKTVNNPILKNFIPPQITTAIGIANKLQELAKSGKIKNLALNAETVAGMIKEADARAFARGLKQGIEQVRQQQKRG